MTKLSRGFAKLKANGAKPDCDFAEKKKEIATLDRKIAASLTKLAQGELGRQITQRNDEALLKNVPNGSGMRVAEHLISVLRNGQ